MLNQEALNSMQMFFLKEIKTVQIIIDDFTDLALDFENCVVYDYMEHLDVSYYDDIQNIITLITTIQM